MILGLAVGATSAGKIIAIGRRRTLLMCCAIGMLGVGITLIEDFTAMVVGRTIWGFACGIQTVVTPRYIEEYIPVQVYTTCFGVYYFSQNAGNLCALFSGLLLPPDDQPQELVDSDMWFWIFAFPLLWYGTMLALMLTVVVHDSPKYSLVTGKKKECLAVIQ